MAARANGRPRKEINYKTLAGLCKLQCTGDECASVLGIDYDTLCRALKRDGHGTFADYLKRFGAHGRMSLRRLQWKAANAGNVGMLVWLGKQYLGQRDTPEAERADDAPAPVRVIVEVVDASTPRE